MVVLGNLGSRIGNFVRNSPIEQLMHRLAGSPFILVILFGVVLVAYATVSKMDEFAGLVGTYGLFWIVIGFVCYVGFSYLDI